MSDQLSRVPPLTVYPRSRGTDDVAGSNRRGPRAIPATTRDREWSILMAAPVGGFHGLTIHDHDGRHSVRPERMRVSP